MFTKAFFTFFPPPKFLDEPYAGIDISDDAVRCIEFVRGSGKFGRNGGLVIAKFGTRLLEQGIVEAGFVKEKEKLTAVVAELARELKLDRVRSSLPEEEMYIFKTQVPLNSERKVMAQNIEFKLEENVPLAPADAIFYFDTIPGSEAPSTSTISTSVAVAPRKVIETYIEVLSGAGLTVMSFEMPARAAARALIPKRKSGVVPVYETVLIVHIFKRKMGMYVVYAGVACFTSTISRGVNDDLVLIIAAEIKKIRDYWSDRGEGKKAIDKVVVSGSDAASGDLIIKISSLVSDIPLETANVWSNAFSPENKVSQINAVESLDYTIAAGLALPL